MPNISDLQRRFPALSFDHDASLPRVRCGGEDSAIELFFQGAHLSRFQSQSGREVLFMSRDAQFEIGKGIRGGVPICFPWFGPKKDDPSAAAHGFARTADWEIVEAGDKSLSLSLESNAQTLDKWSHPFRLVYRVEFEDETLRLSLQIHNSGLSAFRFEIALHTYFRVADIGAVEIEGLDGKTYLDKTQNFARKVQNGDVTFAGETDRVYLDAGGPVLMRESETELQISNLDGWRSTIVWNPWSERAALMADLGDDWKRFVCIESGAVADDTPEIAAGESYHLAIEITAGSRI